MVAFMAQKMGYVGPPLREEGSFKRNEAVVEEAVIEEAVEPPPGPPEPPPGPSEPYT